MTDKMPKPDDVVAGYRIVRVIGKGGMGAVFEAVDDKSGQRAAIKVLHAHLSQDQETTARFLNEAKAIATLDHPGIVRLLSSGPLDDGGCYIAMEFIDGETLSAKLKREKRLGREGLRLASLIASALQAAHRRNIVHRDLKPSKITSVEKWWQNFPVSSSACREVKEAALLGGGWQRDLVKAGIHHSA